MKSGKKAWFRLDQLLDSVLADVVAADAHFQLTQTEAWGDFGRALNELNDLPMVEQVDLAVGFGRLENLGLSELSVSLPLEVYRPGWLHRRWWGIIRLFGGKVPPNEERFRLAEPGVRGVIELQVAARRDNLGRWTVAPRENAA